MFQEIYIVDNANELITELRQIFKDDKSYKFTSIDPNNIDDALKNIPDLIVINEENINENIVELCKKIRHNEDNSITPVLVIANDESNIIDIIKNSIEYVLPKSINREYLYYTIKNITRLLSVNRTVSPLTGLPGNVQIFTELKKRLLKKEPFEIFYLDLDNFKAYNDVYGFLKGDEIIKLTAKVITKNVHSMGNSEVFIGHIGGDDFVVIAGGEDNYDEICQNIIAEFDQEILRYFTDEDIERGYIEVVNRKGTVEKIPLTSISIGVVIADKKRFSNILEIGEIGAQVKHMAKISLGSSYAIDRRDKE